MPKKLGEIIDYFRKKRRRNTGAFGKIVAYFKKEHEGYYIIDDERQLVRMYLQGDNQLYQVICSTGELDSVNITIAQLLRIPREKVVPACVLANLVNMRTLATFTIDPDGDLMVTMSLSDKISKITSQALRTAYLRSFKETVTYYPAFYQLVSSDVIPEEAFRCAEPEEGDTAWRFKVPYIRVIPFEEQTEK